MSEIRLVKGRVSFSLPKVKDAKPGQLFCLRTGTTIYIKTQLVETAVCNIPHGRTTAMSVTSWNIYLLDKEADIILYDGELEIFDGAIQRE